ncbi:hypothetical protein BS47DRAFT_1354438 [Hydnum rufescens UP504]|uniref:Secreted protein n=1 Tax=Hydnum rufescens UP504 TaxID=1448309 RepID=A0A9P6AG93_9AGAM|nr:hypothetical protein BS47DRAFT_1354438 [Hydnum rufescens UP504]
MALPIVHVVLSLQTWCLRPLAGCGVLIVPDLVSEATRRVRCAVFVPDLVSEATRRVRCAVFVPDLVSEATRRVQCADVFVPDLVSEATRRAVCLFRIWCPRPFTGCGVLFQTWCLRYGV